MRRSVSTLRFSLVVVHCGNIIASCFTLLRFQRHFDFVQQTGFLRLLSGYLLASTAFAVAFAIYQRRRRAEQKFGALETGLSVVGVLNLVPFLLISWIMSPVGGTLDAGPD